MYLNDNTLKILRENNQRSHKDNFIFSFNDRYWMKRTFESSKFTSLTKTNLPIIYGENFWPQDKFFKRIQEGTISQTDLKAQNILNEIDKRCIATNINLENAT